MADRIVVRDDDVCKTERHAGRWETPMESDSPGDSVTRWLSGMKAGDDHAARVLWQRYFDGLVRLARVRLGGAPRGAADEEDVALSAFHSLCRGAAAGRFPQLADRDNLWRLLATITAQKALDQRRHQGRKKRGGGRTHGATDLACGDSGVDVLAQAVGREPSPEFLVLMDEEYRQQLDRLKDDGLRRIAVWKMEGFGNDEIAQRLDCGLRTVERKLAVIRTIWLAQEAP
jgi:DNA-directed RNA polymerase specialized sigma24 family protein